MGVGRKKDSLYDDKFNNIISVETYQRLFKTTEEDIKTANEKLEKLKQNNKNPFEITKFDITHTSKEIIDNYEELEGKDV